MRRVVDAATEAAAAGHPVLLVGEAGTGKDALAAWIHACSPRARAQLYQFDCTRSTTAWSPEWRALSTLSHPIFKRGGTLLLHGVDRMASQVEAELLSACVHTLLYNQANQVIVTSRSTRASLMEAAGQRGDLMRGLRAHDLRVPPLRERRPDIPQLVREILRGICRAQEIQGLRPDASALDALCGHHWAGNVAELEHVLERAALAAEGKAVIGLDDLPRAVRREIEDEKNAEIETLAAVEKRHILATSQAFRGNRQATADALGIGVNTLWRRLKEYGIARDRGGPGPGAGSDSM